MARPGPQIIATLEAGERITDICWADAVYAVYYQGRAIKVRSRGQDMINGFKYGRTSFPEPAHAIRLAQRLNRELNTDDFTVVELRIGRAVALV